MKLSEVKIKPPKVLLYGPFGSGKTCFAMTGGKYVQYLDMDEGLQSGKKLKDSFTEIRGEIDVLEAHEDDPNRALAFMKARSYIQSISEQCRKGTYPFKILVIDSLTNLHEFCMRMIMSNSGILGQKPKIQNWMMRDIEFINLCLLLKTLPIAVIVIAHQQVNVEDEVNVLTPFLPGKSLPNNFFSKFDEILYMKPRLIAGGKTSFTIHNLSTSCITARTRSNFPDKLDVSIGLLKLLEYMEYKVS